MTKPGKLGFDFVQSPGGDGQCDNPGTREIPHVASVSGAWTTWSTPYRIDTDDRGGGCLQTFRVEGRTDVVLDVSWSATDNPAPCHIDHDTHALWYTLEFYALRSYVDVSSCHTATRYERYLRYANDCSWNISESQCCMTGGPGAFEACGCFPVGNSEWDCDNQIDINRCYLPGGGVAMFSSQTDISSEAISSSNESPAR